MHQVGSYIEDSPLRRSLQPDRDSDDEPALSASALDALKEFSCREAEDAGTKELFREIWGLSQVFMLGLVMSEHNMAVCQTQSLCASCWLLLGRQGQSTAVQKLGG